MLESPDLDQAFGGERERTRVIAQFLSACVELEDWKHLVGAAIPPPGDTTESRRRRFLALFDEELTAVFDARNRVVHGLRLSDRELRGAVWLAQRLLAVIRPPSPG